MAGELGVPEHRALDDLATDDRRDLEALIRRSTVEIRSGHDDHVLHVLHATIDFEAAMAPSVKKTIADLAGARVEIALTLDAVDRPVTITAPPGAKPLP